MPDADSAAQESRKPKQPAATALTEERALGLCKLAGLEPTADLLEALKGATLEQGMAIIGLTKRAVPVPQAEPPPRPSAPRSAGPRVNVSEGALPKDSKGWAEKLLK